MKKFLVVGGAGYIGSTLSYFLLDEGYQVTILDNLSTGKEELIPPKASFIKGDLNNQSDIDKCFDHRTYDAVFHFAGLSLVGESISRPELYLDQNFNNARRLILSCVKNNVEKFVFSSTANIFGNCSDNLISENSAINPSSPYGESKLMVENFLKWVHQAHPTFNYSCLRYFNAAGAEKDLRSGECHDPETHLIPLTIRALNQESPLTVFGNDYKTKDGTCVRDYIHVDDLASAHYKVLNVLSKKSQNYNIGIGKGYTIMDIINEVEKVSNSKVHYKIGSRRSGDPESLVASNSSFVEDTGWIPLNNITDIIQDAFLYEKKRKRRENE